MWLLLSTALAGDLNFSPDRPGIGDSTGTPGAGRVMFEGGLAGGVAPSWVGTSGLTFRAGLGDSAEARVHVPDVLLAPGSGVGATGVGAKFAQSVNEWSMSAVPEVWITPNGGALAGTMGFNGAWSADGVGLWAHASLAVAQTGAAGLAGGGVAASLPGGGIYGHGGINLNARGGFVGLGGWWSLSESAQLDLALDVVPGGAPVLGLGVSVGG